MPVAATTKLAGLPTHADAADGWLVIAGALFTVSAAPLLVVEQPLPFDTTHMYVAASPEATLLMVSVAVAALAFVPAEIFVPPFCH